MLIVETAVNKSPKQTVLYNLISRNFCCGYNKAQDNIKRFIIVHKVGFTVCLQQFNNIVRFLFVSKLSKRISLGNQQ